MFKKLVFAGCLSLLAFTGVSQAKETYVVGAGGTYRPFEFENSENNSKDLISILLKRSPPPKILMSN